MFGYKTAERSETKAHNRRFRGFIAIVTASLMAAALASCGSADSSSAAKAASLAVDDSGLKIVNVGLPMSGTDLSIEGITPAQASGILSEELEKAGYKLNAVGFGAGGTAVNEALASGQVDLAFMGDVPEVIAASNGVQVQAFASLNSASNLGVLVGKDTGIKTVSDLKGKRVVIAFGTVTHKYLNDVLKENGLTLDDVELINDIANAATLIASGDADAVVSTAVGLYSYQAAGIGDVIDISLGKPELAAQFFAVGRTDFLESNPDVPKAIIKALIRSRQWSKENPDKVYEAFGSDSVPAELYKNVYPSDTDFDYFDPQITDEGVKKLKELSTFLLDNGITTKEADIDSFVNTSYYDEAVKETSGN